MEYWKSIRSHAISTAVIFLVAIIVLWSISQAAFSVNERAVSLAEMSRDLACVKREGLVNDAAEKRTVVLRLDDVQSFMWADISRELISGALENGATLSVGVIPKGIEDDIETARFLRQERCNIEIALHGWDHGRSEYDSKSGTEAPPEFRGMSYDQAKKLIGEGKKELEALFDDKVTTFIPPNNESSEGTVEALQSEGFSVYSSDGESVYDYTIPTFDFNTKAIVPIDNVISACEKRFAEGKFCIIMLHPQEYSNGDGALNRHIYENHYLEMIKKLRQGGVEFSTFKKLNESGIQDDRLWPSDATRGVTANQQ
jgi:peptidoglycan/xylan/chitin deacetylase (PgdA/CDA1 family)